MAQQLLQQQLDKAEHVVAFGVASRLSSLYNTIRLAAQDVDPKRITVIDSGQASMGLGWMVVAAAEAAERGANLDEVLAAVQSTRERVREFFTISTLEYLKRGGRVNTLFASVGTLLQIKPIIELHEGVVSTIQRARTMGKATQAIIDLTHSLAPLERLSVLHTNAPAAAADLLARLADITPPDTITVDVTTAIGTHIGPGGLGIALVRKSA
jgi:DegV family protein with EDD domain